MSTVLLAMALALPFTTAQDTRAAAEAQAAGRYAEAWAILEGLPEDPERQRARAAVLAAAGDLGGSLKAAERGLELDPGHLELRWRASALALTLSDAERAARHAEQLTRAVRAARTDGRLDDGDQEAWEETARRYELQAAELERNASERESAIERARRVSTLLIALLVTALLSLLWPRARLETSGQVQ